MQFKVMKGTSLEEGCNQKVLVSNSTTVMASSHEVNVNVHMHMRAHTAFASFSFRSHFLFHASMS